MESRDNLRTSKKERLENVKVIVSPILAILTLNASILALSASKLKADTTQQLKAEQITDIERYSVVIDEAEFEENEVPKASSYITYDEEDSEKIDDEEDPLSGDRFDDAYVNKWDEDNHLQKVMDKYSEYLSKEDVPFIIHPERNYSKCTELDILIIKKIVYSEIGLCSFEQQAATAAMCLNMMEQFDTDMYSLASTPNVFDVSYAEAPWPELTEKNEKAVELALEGIDFSCGGVAFCTYELIDPSTKDWFDSLALTAEINVSTFYNDEETDKISYYYQNGEVIN